jgi:hypothetical protein
MITFIVGPQMPKPETASVAYKAPVDRFDSKLIATIAQSGDRAAPLWSVVHQIVADEGPASRSHQRQLCSRLLCRLRGLIRAGKIVRESNSHVRLAAPPPPVAPTPLPPSLPTPKPVKNWPPAVTPCVTDLATFQPGGPRTRTFRV